MRSAPKRHMPVQFKFDENAPVMAITDIDPVKNSEFKNEANLGLVWFDRDGRMNTGKLSTEVVEKFKK